LYPHLSVYRNLAFGLEIRHEPAKERDARVRQVADMLGLTKMLDRKPSALSGGQRQRIALGRAMITEPKLFLLDEPLSNLDAALRTQMRLEISDMQRRLGVPTVYVTHDQVEAMTMGHRIAVFAHGRMMQIGTPEQLFKFPMSKDVATFIGSPKMNIVQGESAVVDGLVAVRLVDSVYPLSKAKSRACSVLPGVAVDVGLRPQDIHWIQDAPSRCKCRMKGTIENVEPTGAETFVVVNVAGQMLNTKFPSFAPVKRGEAVELAFDQDDLHLFDRHSGESLIDSTELERLAAFQDFVVA
jgi:multiple sugar transport system ATP-binding protein